MKPLSKGVIALFFMLVFSALPGFCQLQRANTFVYVNNDIYGPNSVSAYSVQVQYDTNHKVKTVNLNPIGKPVLTGGNGAEGGCSENHIAIAGTFVYVTNDVSNTISGFSITPATGALTPVTVPPVPSGLEEADYCMTLAATPNGKFLYVSSFDSGAINAFTIESNGALTPGPGQKLRGGAIYMKVSPNGKFLAAITQEDIGSRLTMFTIDKSNGALTAVSSEPSFGGSLDFNCASNLLYIAAAAKTGEIAVRSVSRDGALSPFPGSPFSFNNGGYLTGIPVLSPDDLHLFATSFLSGGSVASLNIGLDGVLTSTQKNPFATFSTQPQGMATDQLGDLLFVTTSIFSPSSLYVYSINRATGALTSRITGYKLADSNGSASFAVFPPKTCFGNLAAKYALNDDPGKYGYGGKGFDYAGSGKPGQPWPAYDGNQCAFQFFNGQGTTYAPCWITASEINKDYYYYDSNSPYVETPRQDYGMDCSGLVMWSYNTAVNATIEKPEGAHGKPAPSKDLPIWYDGAGSGWVTVNIASISRTGNVVTVTTSTINPFMKLHSVVISGVADSSFSGRFVITSVISSKQFTYAQAGSDSVSSGGTASGPPRDGQCTDVQSTFLTDDLGDLSNYKSYTAPLSLRPGDLLCFNYHPGGGHVAMYLGNLGQPGKNTIEDFDRRHGGVVTGDVDTRPFVDVAGDTNCSLRNPTKQCFDFLGYRRPRTPRVAILFQVHSPVSLSVTDPRGFTIDDKSWTVTEHQAYRAVGSLAYNDYSPSGDDMVFSPILESGAYIAKVEPKPGTTPSDVYGLTVTAGGRTITLADQVPISQIPPLGYGVESNGTTITPFTPVAIEIKPGSVSPTPINIKSSGKIPVAILSAANFNALREVNASSLTFGREGDERSFASCNMNGEDVNGDGLPDLVCHFYTQETGFQAGDAQGVLKGLTYSGQVIRGTGAIQIVP